MVDTLEVLWPGGTVDTYVNVVANQTLSVEEGASSGVEDVTLAGSAPAFSLVGNFPNPFYPRTTIRYVLPGRERVRAEVFDLMGRRVAVLVDEVQTAGEKSLPWDAASLASGVYWLRVQAGKESRARKMILLK